MNQDIKSYKITTFTGIAIVMANMIGTGAFTSLGFQLNDLHDAAVVITLWVLGGLLAIAGAFSYAEIGTIIKKSGGEYAYLSHMYHPAIGYLSGWISLTVGFAAPIALSAIAFTEYLPFGNLYPKATGIALVWLITFMHTKNLKTSSQFQNISTVFKFALMAALILIGLVLPKAPGSIMFFERNYFSEIGSPAFAIALIYVSYSYSGWNAAAYITEEFKDPTKSLPTALVGGTALVTLLYTLLQFVFLKHVPASELAGQLNVGTIATEKMLGNNASKIFGIAISILLISGISAMVWIGPRITSNIAKEHRLWHYFQAAKSGIPKRALWLQFGISVILILTGTFEQIMIYCGMLLTISAMFTVLGLFHLRRRNEHKGIVVYKSPLFPFFQLLFLLLSLWMVVFAFMNNTLETIAGMGNLVLGLISYRISRTLSISNPITQ